MAGDFGTYSLVYVRANERAGDRGGLQYTPPPGFDQSRVVLSNWRTGIGWFTIQAKLPQDGARFERLSQILGRADNAVLVLPDSIRQRLWQNFGFYPPQLAGVAWLAVLVEMEMQGIDQPRQLPQFWDNYPTENTPERIGELMRRTMDAGDAATERFDWHIEVDDVADASRGAVEILIDWLDDAEQESTADLATTAKENTHRSNQDVNASGANLNSESGPTIEEIERTTPRLDTESIEWVAARKENQEKLGYRTSTLSTYRQEASGGRQLTAYFGVDKDGRRWRRRIDKTEMSTPYYFAPDLKKCRRKVPNR